MKPKEAVGKAAEELKEAERGEKKPYSKPELSGYGGVERLTGSPQLS